MSAVMVECVCRECGSSFSIRACLAAAGRGKYCTLRCFHRANTKYKPISVPCAGCGVPFTTNKQQARALATGEQIAAYCTADCYLSHQPDRAGEHNARWKGGTTESNGYIYRRDKQLDVSPYSAEHRRLVERAIGRHLRRFEVVHHINGDRRDNRLDNLTVMTISEHMKLHATARNAAGKALREANRNAV